VSVVSVAEFDRIVRAGLPLVAVFGIETLELGPGTARLRLPGGRDHVRPGGTVAGPALFALADVALYAAVLSRIGPVELAVTTSMTINFLRKPAPRPVIAEARLLKLGRRLAYGEVLLLSDGEADPVAHATGTYSIPPDRPSP
jgi:uncharacterized protein (TIGR00369 family)